jgi:NAD(P)-dependent dehydrogenase (short-subunit alcohol dehydrogenase family)
MTGLSSLQTGYRALVIGASGGIGSAIVAALEADPRCGAAVAVSRGGEIRLDTSDEASVAATAAALAARHGSFDLVFNATGALTIGGTGPEKMLRAIDPAAMIRQFQVNAVGPALLFKHFAPLMPRDRRCLFGSLSARVGSIGDNRLGGWISYRAAKAAHNQIVRTAAIEIARTHPAAVVVALHPGSVATALSEPFSRGHERISPAQSAALLLETLDGLAASQSGGFFAYDGKPIEW